MYKIGQRVLVLSTVNPTTTVQGTIRIISDVDLTGCYLKGGGYGLFHRFQVLESEIVKEILSHYDID